MATLIGKIYSYLNFSAQSDHHPSYESGLYTFTDTVDKDTSFEIKFSRGPWAYPYVTNTSKRGFDCVTNSMGQLNVLYYNTVAASNVGDAVIKYDKNYVYVNNVLQSTMSVPSTSASGFKLIASKYGDSGNQQNFYYCKLWQNNVLTRDIVSMVSNSQNGIYDKVSHTFYASNRSCTPNTFVEDYYLYSINVSAGTGGSVTGGGNYYTGDSVVVTATPNQNYTFTGWYSNGSLVSLDNPYTFSASSDISLNAVFSSATNCRFKVNGEWKNADMYKKINGVWVKGAVYIKVNGSWKS